jgi:hypothetical protein
LGSVEFEIKKPEQSNLFRLSFSSAEHRVFLMPRRHMKRAGAYVAAT